MYPANNGDAFLISASVPEPITILIDGGYVNTYRKYISPDLRSLASEGRSLDMVLATHIDADHILGLIEFFKCNGRSKDPKIIPVKNVLHNSVRSLNSLTTDAIRSDDSELLNEIALQGYPNTDVQNEQEVSAAQGSSLAALLLGGEYNWNFSNGNKSINNEDFSIIKLGDGVKLQVVAPQPVRLEQLKNWWLRELRRLGFIGNIGNTVIFDDAFEFLCAQNNLSSTSEEVTTQISGSLVRSLDEVYTPDTSVTNSSSIAFIANIGSLKLLFLGDAWSEDIELQIQDLRNDERKLIFIAIKVSHHGSLHNTSTSLLELIDSPAYFISSNGSRHNHPDIEVLKAIVDRSCAFERNLYFSHSTPASKFMKSYKSKSGTSFVVHENANDWIDLTTELL